MFQSMLEQLVGLLLLAFTLERGVEYVFSMQPFCMLNERFKNLKLKTFIAFLMGCIISYYAQINIIGIFLNKPELNGLVGVIFSGLLLAGGSNVFSDIMTMIQNLKNSIPTSNATTNATDTTNSTVVK